MALAALAFAAEPHAALAQTPPQCNAFPQLRTDAQEKALAEAPMSCSRLSKALLYPPTGVLSGRGQSSWNPTMAHLGTGTS